MTQAVPFARPDISAEDISRVVAALESGWITSGPESKRFEEEFAAAVGARHAVALSSCTAALHLALEALGVGPGDEVILPTMTFAACGEVVCYLGATPVLVDIDAGDHTLDPDAAEAAITPRTRALLAVDFAGQPGRLDRLQELAKARGLPVVEDAAHSFQARLDGRPVGSLSDITCFSFYATKAITTGEGGMATTDDDGWAERMRLMSLHGLSRDAWRRYSAEGSWYYEILAPGFKYNMSDIQAALGLAQLRRAGAMLRRRLSIAEAYRTSFEPEVAIELLEMRPSCEHAWHLFVIKLRPETLRIDRNAFIEELRGRGIGTSVHFIPLHLHPYYRETHGYRPTDLPVALDAYERSVSLPIYSKMTDAQVTRVIEAVLEVARSFRR